MRARTAHRLAWGSLALSLLLVLSGLAIGTIGVRLTFASLSDIVPSIGFLAVFGTVGALIASRRPENAIGWLFCGITVFFSLSAPFSGIAERSLLTGHTISTLARASDWVGTWSWIPTVVIPITLVFLLFPTGRALPRRWRALPWIAVLGTIVFTLGSAFEPARYSAGDTTFLKSNPFGLSLVGSTLGSTVQAFAVTGVAISAIGGIASLVIRLRRAVGEERQQLRLFTATAAATALTMVVTGIVSAFAPRSEVVTTVAIAVILVALTAIPVSVGVAILRYRLYDIDVVINRTLVFGALAGFIALTYVGIVVGIGRAIGEGSSLGLSIAATALVALAFHPVQVRVQRFANRLVYGARATPYEVMTDFADRIAGTLTVEDALPQLAEAAARGLGARWSRVRLVLPDGGLREVHWPDGPVGETPTREIAVAHGGERIGTIAVAKAAGQPITPAEERLLEDLASQAGISLRNVRLALELERRLEEISERSEQLKVSRQRLVTARDAQRRQLERDIREGAQGQLLEIGSKLEAAAASLEADPDTAISLLDELGWEANAALEDLRDLARGIFPPLLAEEGIRAALEAHIRKVGVPAKIEVAPEVHSARFDPDTEAAVYFCCVQALQNVARHAGDTVSTVRLVERHEVLEFAVEDHGIGFDVATTPRGMGLQIMQDRIEALGGTLEIESAPGRGTTVTGRVPVEAEVAVG